MAGDTMRFRNPAGHAGLLNNLLSLANSLAGFFEARAALFAQESKSALVHVLILVGGLVGGLLLLGFGYVFLIVSAVFAIAHAAGVSWVWIAFGAGVLHLLLALGCVLVAKAQLSKPMFSASVIELKKDREWLKTQDRQNLRTS